MQDYAAARRTMVDCQVRTFDVTDLSVIAAFDVTPREIYVPAGREATAYGDVAVPLDSASNRSMLPPLVAARMLQALGPLNGLKVLEIGAGTGYVSALLGRAGAKVTALEADAELAAAAKINLERDGVSGVQVVSGEFAKGYPAGAPYDAIFLNGGFEVLPDAIPQQLADGGAMVGVEVEGAASRIIVLRRASGVNSRAVVVNAWAPVLDGFQKAPAFNF